MGQVRIIAGIHRSRIIKFSDHILGLRPTLDYVRETLFNWLGQDLTGKTCIDLFAGSGALGFEAISRNAKSVIMVEQNSQVANDLKTNQALLKCDNLNVVVDNGVNYLATCSCDFDVLFLDPPYDSGLLNQCLEIIYQRRIDMQNKLIYVECKKQQFNQLKELIANSKHTSDLSNCMVRYTILKQKKTKLLCYMLIKLH